MALQPGAGFGCCPWRERERGWRGRRGRRAERAPASQRLCDYITVIIGRLNSRAASFEVFGEIAFVYKRRWDHILFVLRKERGALIGVRVCDIHPRTGREQKGENWIVCWVMKGRRKKGTIRKTPQGWRYQIASSVKSRGNLCWDLILQCDYVTERKKDLKSNSGLQHWGG